MLIRCPTCATGYDLAPHLLPEGRVLRCATCRDAWVHGAGAPVASGPVGAARRRGTKLAPRRGGVLRGACKSGAAVLALAALAAPMAAVGQRERVVRVFPQSAAAFAALGLPVNLRGLALADVRAAVAPGDGAPVLKLEGTIANLRPASTPVPALRIAVRDAGARVLYSWTAPAPKGRLAPGESVPFQARLATPPRDGETLQVSFVDAPPAMRRLAQAWPAER